MGKDLDINNKIQTYIQNLSQPLHPIQKEIIAYNETIGAVSYTHLRAHETVLDLVCRLLLEKKKT